MWTGQRYDAPTGLYHFTFRTYSPELGRWLQRDPLGCVDGVNLFEYVAGRPLFWGDPFGLLVPGGVPAYTGDKADEINERAAKAIMESAGSACAAISAGARAAEDSLAHAYQAALPDEVHAFIAAGGHIPVLDPGKAQDIVPTVSNTIAVFAPVPGAQAKAATTGGKLVGFIVKLDDGYAFLQFLEDPSLDNVGAALGVLPGGRRSNVDETLGSASNSGRRCLDDVPSCNQRTHGNSATSPNAQHGYLIHDTKTGQTVKVGVSGQPRRANGDSPRANQQVNKWNTECGDKCRYQAEIVKEIPAGDGARSKILV